MRTMTTENQAAQELAQAQESLLWIAGMERKCGVNHALWKPRACPLCGDTGTVARFPQLQGFCSCSNGKVEDWPTFEENGSVVMSWIDDPKCQGRGWLPVSIRDGASELRNLEEFRAWICDVWLDEPESIGVLSNRDFVDFLCDEVAVILAAEKWQQEANDA